MINNKFYKHSLILIRLCSNSLCTEAHSRAHVCSPVSDWIRSSLSHLLAVGVVTVSELAVS